MSWGIVDPIEKRRPVPGVAYALGENRERGGYSIDRHYAGLIRLLAGGNAQDHEQ